VVGVRNTITGNTVYENPVNLPNTGHGIIIEGDDNVVSGNVIYNNSGDGVQLIDALNVVIIGNRCTANANYGVNETGTSDYTLLDGNNLIGNTVGSHTVDAPNSLVGDNRTV